MEKEKLKESMKRRFSMREKWANENHYGTKLSGIVMCTLDIRNYIDHLEDIVLGKKESSPQLESRIKELEGEKSTELITEMDGVCGAVLYEITKTKCCGIAPITSENFCPNCGRKILR